MNLNKASLDVWYDLLQEEKYQKISDRIIYLDQQDSLNEDETLELSTLLNLEKKFLKISNENVDNNKKVIKKVSYYKNHFKEDERLITLFLDRVKNRILSDKALDQQISEALVTQEYVNMMEEDMDIKGHDKLNKQYQDMLLSHENFDDILGEYETCSNPNCIYCKPSDEKEATEAYERLSENGLLEDLDENTLIGLMITITRLEAELAQYTEIDCSEDEEEGFNVDDEDDD